MRRGVTRGAREAGGWRDDRGSFGKRDGELDMESRSGGFVASVTCSVREIDLYYWCVKYGFVSFSLGV